MTTQQASQRSRFLEAVSLHHERTQEAWSSIDTKIRNQAIDAMVDADDLTAWYRLAIEHKWWETLDEAVAALGAFARPATEVDTADRVIERAALVLLQPRVAGDCSRSRSRRCSSNSTRSTGSAPPPER